MMLTKTVVALSISLVTPTLTRPANDKSDSAITVHSQARDAVAIPREATASKGSLTRLALWPVYFYGCDDTPSDPCE